jgi:hypothetical protein
MVHFPLSDMFVHRRRFPFGVLGPIISSWVRVGEVLVHGQAACMHGWPAMRDE